MERVKKKVIDSKRKEMQIGKKDKDYLTQLNTYYISRQ